MSREKQVSELLGEVNLDDSFVVGYYGGGNFGDELLFEVLQHLLHARGYQNISFLFQRPEAYRRYHSDLGYKPVDAGKKWAIVRALFGHKRLVVGGGGLWGLDMNFNVVLMSIMLFVARFLLGKEVYMLGVGYYDSTTRFGHFAAWLAGKSANQILARDNETLRNFSRLNPQTYLTDDIAFNLPNIKADVPKELAAFEESTCSVDAPTVMISLRRFKPHQAVTYAETIGRWLNGHPETRVILTIMEPREIDQKSFMQLKQWQRDRGNAVVIDSDYNPLVLYRFFEKYRDKLTYIGPQFHVQLVAHLSGVRFIPFVYDNKVAQLHKKLGYKNSIPIDKLSTRRIEQFLNGGV